jgi:DNA processing protein
MKDAEKKRQRAALGIAYACSESSNAVLRLLRGFALEDIWTAGLGRLEKMGMPKFPAQNFLAAKRLRASARVLDEAPGAIEAAGLRFVPFGCTDYPAQLLDLSHPPAGIFLKGDLGHLHDLARSVRVTIVGTRKATAYGNRAALEFAQAFAARGIAVISGMALGIDGRAHEAALDGGGITAAVLGCGADVVYPARHRALYGLIVEKGLIMSELPPGAPPSRWTFPNRNRLLAALGDAVLVIEGAVTSGAMQTAEQAAHLGRPVFAVPGSIYADGHRGCNLLIRDGGVPALDPELAVEEFLLQTRIERGERRPPEPERVPAAGCQDLFRDLAVAGREAILEAMAEQACSVDALVLRTGMAARRLTGALAELELAGLVARAGPGLYIRAP